MKFENTTVLGLENAIIGLRLPMSKDFTDAKNKSDSVSIPGAITCNCIPVNANIGADDMRIMQNLVKADGSGRTGEPNSKFLRMIHVQVAITAPLYFWKEADTYKIGTVANSTSTMHKLASSPITKDCFEYPEYIDSTTIEYLESLRVSYKETGKKETWKILICNLPESWLQTRMFDCNYAVLRNIYAWRRNHKLTEWHSFCDWIESLPYSELITAGAQK